MKNLAVLAFVAVALPSLTYTQLDPLTAIGLATVGAIGLGLAAAGGAAVGGALAGRRGRSRGRRYRYHRGRGRYNRGRGRYYRRHRYRYRREVEDEVEEYDNVDEMMNTILDDITEEHVEGCFQRLLCDISADPSDFGDNQGLKAAIEMSDDLDLEPEAKMVAKRLHEAVRYGQSLEAAGLGAEECEAVFNQCPFTGKTMDTIITQFRAGNPIRD